jgi:hypothetical protein
MRDFEPGEAKDEAKAANTGSSSSVEVSSWAPWVIRLSARYIPLFSCLFYSGLILGIMLEIARKIGMSEVQNVEANAVAQRRALKQSTPRARLDFVHTEDARLLPNRSVLLERLPKNGIVAEVGVAFGDYTREILRVNTPNELHLIDSWASKRYEHGLETIQKEFADLIKDERLQIHRGLSHERLKDMPDYFFDWVYIDTNHSYGTTFKELRICHSKVKPTGRISGHDFCTGNVVDPVPYGVIEACNKFCVDFGWCYEYLTIESHGHFSFCLKRIGNRS